MAQAFISYSREDRAFVVKLRDAFDAAQRDVWVDLKDIPPTSEWLGEIYGGIEGADAFVYVLSPSSLASHTCGQELAHALECKKRIVPVVCRDVDPRQVHPQVAAINWIFFRPQDDFDAAFAQLTTALDTDLGYWHLASRLLTRAHQWETKHDDRSLALRGSELAEAERWMVEGAGKQPTPTALQIRFITTSRRSAVRQQRLRVGLLSAVSAIMAILTIVTYLFYQDSQAQRATAIFRLLLAQSTVNLDSRQEDVALLDAIQASGLNDTLDSRTALFTALEGNSYLDAVLDNGHSLADSARQAESGEGAVNVMFSHDGRTVMAARANGQITLWDVATKKQRSEISVPHDVSNAILSPDGQVVLSRNFLGSSELWDATTGAELAQITGEVDELGNHTAAFSPDGNLLALSDCDDSQCNSSHLDLWDIASQRFVARLPHVEVPEDNQVAFSPDGKLLASLEGDGNTRLQLTVWDLASGSQRFVYPLTVSKTVEFESTFAFILNGKVLAVADCDQSHAGCPTNRLRLFYVATWTQQNMPGDTSVDIGRIAFGPDGHTYVGGVNSSMVDFVGAPTGCASDTCSPVSLSGHTDAIVDLDFSPDGHHFASAGLDGKVLLWNVTPFGLPVIQLGPEFDGKSPLLFTPDGKHVVAGNCRGQIIFWDVATGQRSDSLAEPVGASGGSCAAPDQLAFDRSGRLLAVRSVGSTLMLWDLSIRTAIQFKVDFCFNMALSLDGRFLASTDNTTVSLFNARTGVLIQQIPLGTSSSTSFGTPGLAFTADGQLLAIGGSGSSVTLSRRCGERD